MSHLRPLFGALALQPGADHPAVPGVGRHVRGLSPGPAAQRADGGSAGRDGGPARQRVGLRAGRARPLSSRCRTGVAGSRARRLCRGSSSTRRPRHCARRIPPSRPTCRRWPRATASTAWRRPCAGRGSGGTWSRSGARSWRRGTNHLDRPWRIGIESPTAAGGIQRVVPLRDRGDGHLGRLSQPARGRGRLGVSHHRSPHGTAGRASARLGERHRRSLRRGRRAGDRPRGAGPGRRLRAGHRAGLGRPLSGPRRGRRDSRARHPLRSPPSSRRLRQWSVSWPAATLAVGSAGGGAGAVTAECRSSDWKRLDRGLVSGQNENDGGVPADVGRNRDRHGDHGDRRDARRPLPARLLRRA